MKVTKGHGLSVWEMEEDTDEENSQGNKLVLKHISLRKTTRVHSLLLSEKKNAKL